MAAGRALVCSPVMPAFDRESGSRRVFDLIEFLQEAGWEVSFAAGNAKDGERYAKILRQRGVATFLDFDDIGEVITAGRFDAAILAFWYVAESLTPLIRKLSPDTRVIVDSIDLHFVRTARAAFLEPSGTLDAKYASHMAREMNAYATADAVLTVSQKEADLINDLVGDPTLAHTVPLGEDLPPSPLPFAERKGILFIGNFRHPPNAEAVEYLCSEIIPSLDPTVAAEHPVYIVGNALDETVRSHGVGMKNVQMVGWVPSLLPYLQRSRISVVPLLHGAGTKGKLIQALMVGTPSVSTSIGVEGLDLRDGEHVLVADDPKTFADAMVRLLEDEVLWERLAQQGKDHIGAAHGREVVRTRFMQTVSAVLAKEAKGEVELVGFADGDVQLFRLDVNQENLEVHNENLRAHVGELEHRLHSIENSRTWRMFGFYRRLRAALASSRKSG